MFVTMLKNILYVFTEYTALYYLGGQFPFFDLVFVCKQLNAKGCLVLATGSRRIKNNWQTTVCYAKDRLTVNIDTANQALLFSVLKNSRHRVNTDSHSHSHRDQTN
jgi:hypothetical protein